MPRRFRGFISPLERKYLEFLKYKEPYGLEIGNRPTWNDNEQMRYRFLDYQIRWKTRQALRELRLVFEKFGLIELWTLFEDPEVMSNIRFLNEKVRFVEEYKEARRRERETG